MNANIKQRLAAALAEVAELEKQALAEPETEPEPETDQECRERLGLRPPTKSVFGRFGGGMVSHRDAHADGGKTDE